MESQVELVSWHHVKLCKYGFHGANKTVCKIAGLGPLPKYSSRQKWCPEYQARLFLTIVEHTAAELFDAATQDRCTTYVTMRVGIDRLARNCSQSEHSAV